MELYLDRLELVNFKNYPQADISFSRNFNCITGTNGSGKTTLLDALYYLSTCKSFLNPSDQQNIRHDQPFFVIHGQFSLKNEKEDIYCGFTRGQRKQFKRNQKEYPRLADHVGLLPVVLVTPEDAEIISGISEVRRKFMDGIMSQADSSYLSRLIEYNRALLQRNAYLKQAAQGGRFDAMLLDIWDEQIGPLGDAIFQSRSAFVRDFIPLFSKYYKLLSGAKELPGISYRSQLLDASMQELLKKEVQADRQATHTTQGIHKDDLVFTLDDFPVKRFGSQGQQKTFLLSLRLAQYFYLKNRKGIKPVLLLDDIYDKLDENRIKSLLEIVAGPDFGQVFITDTQPQRNSELLNSLAINFRIFVTNPEGVGLYEEKIERTTA